MNLFDITMTLLIGGLFMVFAAVAPFAERYRTRGLRLLAVFASFVLLVGAAGFFGSALSAAGGLNWLPPSFEWPVGYARGIVSLPDGRHVVPHTPSGRVQVYDPNWHYLRGWQVDARGGSFTLAPEGEDRIEVFTARANRRYTYALDGRLIASGNYAPGAYPSGARGEAQVVPTRLWLWTFTHPGLAWAATALGMGLLAVAQWMNRRPACITSTELAERSAV
jgi:hypothetical protein